MPGETLLTDFLMSLLVSGPIALAVVVHYARRRRAGKVIHKRAVFVPAE